MQRVVVGVFLLILAISSPAADEGLWSAASAAYGRGLDYEAGYTKVWIEELDSNNQAIATEFGEISTRRVDGILSSTVIRAEKNGKDVTADWQRRYNRSSTEGRGGPPAGFDATPFDPGWTTALSQGQPRRVSDGLLIPYTIKRDGVELEGSAVFNTAGIAVSASQSWLSLPPLVSAMSSTILYRELDLVAPRGRVASGRDKALVARSMQIEGTASILFVKKRFRMSFEFDEWRPKPPGS